MFSGSQYSSGNNLLGPQNFWTGFVGDPIILDKIFGALQKNKKKDHEPKHFWTGFVGFKTFGQDFWGPQTFWIRFLAAPNKLNKSCLSTKLLDWMLWDPKTFGQDFLAPLDVWTRSLGAPQNN